MPTALLAGAARCGRKWRWTISYFAAVYHLLKFYSLFSDCSLAQ